MRSKDIMERLIAMMAEEKAKLAELEAQMAEGEWRKREGKGPAPARTEDSGMNIMPAQGVNDRA